MPYIKQWRREDIEGAGMIHSGVIDTAGELNFAITKLVTAYIKGCGTSYQTINDAIGALECAKLELYRRLAAPHEDQKIVENGDVY